MKKDQFEKTITIWFIFKKLFVKKKDIWKKNYTITTL